jgi:hypothetical protein
MMDDIARFGARAGITGLKIGKYGSYSGINTTINKPKESSGFWKIAMK